MTDDLPDACTLPTAERPLRRAEFDDVFARTAAVERPGPRRARFRLAGAPGLAAQVADLAARETECCAFFAFTVSPLPGGDVSFEVEVPDAHVGVLDAMVARAAA